VLPPLRSVFDCPYVRLTAKGWDCGWCGKTFSGKHSTGALCHVTKVLNKEIGLCQATVPVRYLKRYKAIFEELSE
jgi:hypothetical protein